MKNMWRKAEGITAGCFKSRENFKMVSFLGGRREGNKESLNVKEVVICYTWLPCLFQIISMIGAVSNTYPHYLSTYYATFRPP